MTRKINDNVDLAFNELQNVLVQNIAGPGDPGTGVADGRLYYNVSLSQLRLRAGGSWTSLASGAGYSDEQAQDAVGGMLTGNTESGITVTYDDTNALIDFTVTDSPLLGGSSLATVLARGSHTGTQTASTISDFTEATQDIVGTIVGAGGIVVSYDDAGTGLTTLTLTNNEALQDVIGPFFASGTGSSGITVTYDDAGGDINYVVTDSPLLGGQNSAYHLARANHTGTQAPATVLFAATDKLLGRDTASGGTGEEIGVTGGLVFDGSGNIQTTAFTGDVTKTLGGTALTIGTDKVVTSMILNANVTLAKMADLVQSTFIGRAAAAGTGVPTALTMAQAKTALAIANTDVSGLGTLSTISNLTGPVTSVGAATTITASSVTNAMLANMAANSFKGNNTGGSAVALDLTTAQAKTLLAIASTDVSGLGSLATVSNLTGNVTSVGAATTIAAGVVTNAMQANMNAHTIKGNNTAGATAPIDLTLAQVKTELAYNGTEIVFTPTGNIASTNVSAAIAELETDLTTLISTTIEARTWKDPVDAATTGALPTLTYASGPGTLTATANAALAAQDGVTLAVGEDLLVKDQASTFQDGIYTVTAVGSGAAPFVLTRRADCSTAVELRDATVIVEGGTTQKGDIFTQTASALADLTAAAQTWVQTGEGNTTYVADETTLTKTGNSFSVKNAGVTATQIATSALSGTGAITGGAGTALAVAVGTNLEISSNAIRIAASAAGNGLTGGGASVLAVGAGTGIAVAADAVAVDRATNGAKVALIYAVDLAGGAATETITHSFGTNDVNVVVYNKSGAPFADEDFSIERPSTNQVLVRSSVTIPASTYRVVVMG